jgi:hypothetical protein
MFVNCAARAPGGAWVTRHIYFCNRKAVVLGPTNALQQKDDLLGAFYSITSSASASSLSGTSRPSILAVLRLSTNSNLVDWITGRSADFMTPERLEPR